MDKKEPIIFGPQDIVKAQPYIGKLGWLAGSRENLMKIIGQPDNRSILKAVSEEGKPFQNKAGWKWDYFSPDMTIEPKIYSGVDAEDATPWIGKEGWGEGKIPDEFTFIMGQSPQGSSFNEDGIGTPMFQGNADFGFRFPSERVYTTEPTRFAEPLDTLVSVRAPVGEQNMALIKCCIGRGVAAFRYRTNRDYYTYTYFKIRSLMSEIKQFNDEGTVFGSIGKADFEALDIVIPPQALVKDFEMIARPLNDKIIKNCYQIAVLEQLRDILLPKLMSGGVRVEI